MLRHFAVRYGLGWYGRESKPFSFSPQYYSNISEIEYVNFDTLNNGVPFHTSLKVQLDGGCQYNLEVHDESEKNGDVAHFTEDIGGCDVSQQL